MTPTPRPLYFDIDGTLTNSPNKMWGAVYPERLAKIRSIIADGALVVLWSGNGTEYARAFANHYGLNCVVCVGKPSQMIDDNPNISPSMKHVDPEDFFK